MPPNELLTPMAAIVCLVVVGVGNSRPPSGRQDRISAMQVPMLTTQRGETTQMRIARLAALTSIAASLLAGASAGAQCLRFLADYGPGGGQALDTPSSAAVAPDGKRFYVAARDGLNAYAVDPDTGLLSFLEAERDGVNGVDGIDDSQGVAVSPDGKHVYATGINDDGLAVFATGASEPLTFVEVERNGVGGVSNMDRPVDLTLSPDGRHVYVLATNSSAVVVFSRNSSTGALTFVEAITDASNVELGLDTPFGIDVSPAGDHVYVGSVGEDSVTWFQRDAGDGTLGFAGVVRDGVGADGLAYARDVAVSPDGAFVYAAGYAENEIAIFSRDPDDGSIAYQSVVANGVDGVSGLAGPYAFAIDPDGRGLWVANNNGGGLVGFQRDPATGALRFAEARTGGAPPEDLLGSPSGLGLAPSGRHLYVTSWSPNAVTAYEWPTSLRVVDVERDGDGGVEGLAGPAFVATSPDQRHVYAAGLNDDAIAVFARDGATGALDFVEFERSGVGGVTSFDGPSGIAVSPDGKHLYATALFSDAVALFTRNATTGALTFVSVLRNGFGGVSGIDGAAAILVSPDGDHVYIGGYNGDSLAIFSRNPTSGALTFVDTLFDGVDADALAKAGGAQMAMDALGQHLYVPAGGESALSVFERDPATGLLDEILVLRDDVDSPFLASAFNALLSPDDALLYVTGFLDDAITSFVRDPAFGALDVLEYERNGLEGVTGLDQPRGLATNERGDMLVAAAQQSDSVVAFDHDLDFASTTFAGVATNGSCGYADLDSPSAVAAAGSHFYVTASNSNALVVLTPEPVRALAASVALAVLGCLAKRPRFQ